MQVASSAVLAAPTSLSPKCPRTSDQLCLDGTCCGLAHTKSSGAQRAVHVSDSNPQAQVSGLPVTDSKYFIIAVSKNFRMNFKDLTNIHSCL